MGDSGNATTTTITGPPKEIKPYIFGQTGTATRPAISGFLPQAQKWYESTQPTYFPGSTVAGFTPAQTQGMESGIARAQGGSPLNRAAGGYLQDVIGGRYLGGQSLAPISEAIWGQVQPRVSSAAGLVGRTGSGAHEGVLGREFTNALAPYAFNQYAQERGLQQQAAGMAPGQAATDYQDINAGLQYGGMQQGQNQLGIDAEIARHNFEQNKELAKLQSLAGLVTGVPGSQQVSSVQGGGPGLGQQIAGGLLGAAGTAGNLGWSPFGAAGSPGVGGALK